MLVSRQVGFAYFEGRTGNKRTQHFRTQCGLNSTLQVITTFSQPPSAPPPPNLPPPLPPLLLFPPSTPPAPQMSHLLRVRLLELWRLVGELLHAHLWLMLILMSVTAAWMLSHRRLLGPIGYKRASLVLMYVSSLVEDLTAINLTNSGTHRALELTIAFTLFPIIGGMINELVTCIPGGVDDMLATLAFEVGQTFLYSFYADFAPTSVAVYLLILLYQLPLIIFGYVCDAKASSCESQGCVGGLSRFYKQINNISFAVTLAALQFTWLLMSCTFDQTFSMALTVLLWCMNLPVVFPDTIKGSCAAWVSFVIKLLVFTTVFMVTVCVYRQRSEYLSVAFTDGDMQRLHTYAILVLVASIFGGILSFSDSIKMIVNSIKMIRSADARPCIVFAMASGWIYILSFWLSPVVMNFVK